MNDFSVLIIAVCLGILSVAGIKAIWLTLVGTSEERQIKKLLDNDPELYMELYNIKQKISERIAK